MKNIIVLLLCCFIATSCGKNSKQKISGDWSVTMFEEDRTYTSNTNNSFSRELFRFEGETLQQITENENNSDVYDGTLHDAYWNIKKDGTWERKVSYTVNELYDKHKFTKIETGFWMFYTGVGDYKKHERIVFTTYTISETKEFEDDVQTIDYKIELSETYERKKSKNKTLELVLLSDNNSYSEINYSNETPGGEELENGSWTGSQKYQLTKK